MVSPYWFRTESFVITTAAGTTITHALGVAPTGLTGQVIITQRTQTFPAFVVSSNSQIVVIGAPVNSLVDVMVEQRHTIVGGSGIANV